MPGWDRSIGLRPAPSRRTLPSGTDPGSSSSRLPADTVALDTPASAATAVRPPRPSDSASAARRRRLCDSPGIGKKAPILFLVAASISMRQLWHPGQYSTSYLSTVT